MDQDLASTGTNTGNLHARDGSARKVTAAINEDGKRQGVALGALLGAIVPNTRAEDQLFGNSRDRALDKAKEAATQGYDSLRTTAATGADHRKEAATQSFDGNGHGRPKAYT